MPPTRVRAFRNRHLQEITDQNSARCPRHPQPDVVQLVPRLRRPHHLLQRPPGRLPCQLGDLQRRPVGAGAQPLRHPPLGQRRQGIQARRLLPRQRARSRVDHGQGRRVPHVPAARELQHRHGGQGHPRQVRLLHHPLCEPRRLRLHPDHQPPVAQEPPDPLRAIVCGHGYQPQLALQVGTHKRRQHKSLR